MITPGLECGECKGNDFDYIGLGAAHEIYRCRSCGEIELAPAVEPEKGVQDEKSE